MFVKIQLHGNLRVIFAPGASYYAYEKPNNKQTHSEWVPMISANSPEELKDKAQQHYKNLRKHNPEKYRKVIAPVVGF